MDRNSLVTFLDDYLKVREFQDISLNGLQVEGAPEVTRIAFAVDACQAVFEAAIKAGADFLVVHHGLFWGQPFPITGMHAERFRCLFHAGLNLYAAHLPLDFHPEIGHNVMLCRQLGVTEPRLEGPREGPWFFGGALKTPCPREAFHGQVNQLLDTTARMLPFGPAVISRVAVSCGVAASLIPDVRQAGFDAFITGEPSHSRFHVARELGLNVFFGGHYATETAGLHALQEVTARRFDCDTVFIPMPTDM